MKVYFYSLGCKVNSYDTETMKEQFRADGWTISPVPEGCQCIVVNSCTVTAVSDQKTRQAVRRFKRTVPGAAVVLTGCLPQAFPQQAMDLQAADIVVGNRDHKRILAAVHQFLERREQDSRIVDIELYDHRTEEFESTSIEAFEGRTRAVIKIQDGCNRYCSYCIIPTARGRSRSRSMESIAEELRKIKDAGFREVVLVGINLTCYGLDNGHSFVDPIALACSYGFERVRIGSLEYDNITDEAIQKLTELPNFCPQFHVSLQAGCDKTLKNMRRHYTTGEYAETCEKLRRAFPDATITTDIMVGFPEETEEDFRESLNFARRIGFEKIHVFPYSPRKGTKAAEISPQIPKSVKTDRSHQMLAVAEEIRSDFLNRQIGKTVNVLCETYENGLIHGYTENYTPVRFPAPSPRNNEIVPVTITEVRDGACFGELH
ncbi:MAG: tRNA (N(6)-L-threonylcarbamoyladenosine(37)-C(2))-methylthiotransferase MtaB [Clostridia bacterium]|nr:tRNA (N(6)-L-threonylcarbamoyladenosine(37)-C(2))-methylthiotransferase MtaB [Clostridia bacterium]